MSAIEAPSRLTVRPAPRAGLTRGFGSRGGLLVLAAAVLLCACAAPAQRANMEVGATVLAKKNQHAVAVSVTGGQETENAGSVVADRDFKAAVESSLERSGAFGSVQASAADAGFTLSANIIELRRPIFGSSFTVELEVGWTLTRRLDGAVLLRKAIRTGHTATMSDAFSGAKRMQLAVEGAARNNIESFLKELAGVTL